MSGGTSTTSSICGSESWPIRQHHNEICRAPNGLLSNYRLLSLEKVTSSPVVSSFFYCALPTQMRILGPPALRLLFAICVITLGFVVGWFFVFAFVLFFSVLLF